MKKVEDPTYSSVTLAFGVTQMCDECGALVGQTTIHTDWHKTEAIRIQQMAEFLRGLE